MSAQNPEIQDELARLRGELIAARYFIAYTMGLIGTIRPEKQDVLRRDVYDMPTALLTEIEDTRTREGCNRFCEKLTSLIGEFKILG